MQWYKGDIQTLCDTWEFSDNPFYADYQILGASCAAVSVLMGADNVLPVIVASRGCACHIRFTIVAWGADFNLGQKPFPFIEISEKDVIRGNYQASEKQLESLKKMISRHPVELIALLSNDEAVLSCADLEPLRGQLEKFTGVKTEICNISPLAGTNQWLGYDAALSMLFSSYWGRNQEKNNGINLIGWKWPSRERKHDIGACLSLLQEVGVTVNCVIPGGSSLRDYEKAMRSRVNLIWCPSYIGTVVERMASDEGIPWVGKNPPYGMDGTMEWLREAAVYLDDCDEIMKRAAAVRERYMEPYQEVRKQLQGKRGFISGGPGRLPGLLDVMNDLGVEVPAAALFWPHPVNQDNLKKIYGKFNKKPEEILVAPSLYELDEMAEKYRPDFWMGGFQEQHTCRKYGIPFIPQTVYTASHQCFEGVVNVGKKILKGLGGFNFVANPLQAVEE